MDKSTVLPSHGCKGRRPLYSNHASRIMCTCKLVSMNNNLFYPYKSLPVHNASLYLVSFDMSWREVIGFEEREFVATCMPFFDMRPYLIELFLSYFMYEHVHEVNSNCVTLHALRFSLRFLRTV